MKKIKIISLCMVALIFIVFIFIVVIAIVPYSKEKNISEEFKKSFKTSDYYSETTSLEQVKLLDSGKDALYYRLQVIERAKESIEFSSYSTHDGYTTSMFFAALIKAADRGVKVKILLDGKYGNVNNKIESLLISNKNIEYYLFNEFDIFKPQRINVCLHDKYLIVDNKYMIFGGRNIGDKYYDYENYKRGYSLDREVLVYNTLDTITEKNSIYQVKKYFERALKDKFTKQKTKNKLSDKKLKEVKNKLLSDYSSYCENNLNDKEIDFEKITIKVNSIKLLTNPIKNLKKEPTLAYGLLQLAKENNKVLIQTPYTILTKKHRQILEDLAKTTNVEILTNSLASSPNLPGYSNYLLNRKKYLNMGVTLYEYQNKANSIHAKSLLIGDRLSVIGSFNLDERSIHIDTESVLVIDGIEFFNATKNCIQSYVNNSLVVGSDNKYIENDNLKAVKVSFWKKALFKIGGFVIQPFNYLL